MKLSHIIKKASGKFIRTYDLHYTMKNGGEKVYEMVSRVPIKELKDLQATPAEGVVMILLNEDKTKVLLNKEFRPAVAKTVYNFPAGLIDEGETLETAAKRELFEETGLVLKELIATYNKSYGAVGLSNESAVVCVGIASDNQPFGGNHDPAEEIEPVWIGKEDAMQIIQSEDVTARVQLFLALWATDLSK